MNIKEEYVLSHYEITETGEIYSTLNSNNNFKRKKLKFREDKDGYYDVSLVYNSEGSRMPFRIHRLVALKYLPEIKGFEIVNHLDLDKKNNNKSNLRWSNVSINTQHGYDNCTYKNIKKIKVVELSGEYHIFPSESHASRYYNYKNPSVINAILNGRRNNPIPKGKRKGLFFEYTNEGVTTIERNTSTVTGV